MPKDYMSMAQGAAPAGAELTEQDLQMTDSDYEEMGLPGGEGPDAMKERILTLLEEAGALEGLEKAELQEITGLVDQLVADIEAENFEAVEQNPIMQLLGGIFEEMGAGEAQAPPGAGPMMPGPGGM